MAASRSARRSMTNTYECGGKWGGVKLRMWRELKPCWHQGSSRCLHFTQHVWSLGATSLQCLNEPLLSGMKKLVAPSPFSHAPVRGLLRLPTCSPAHGQPPPCGRAQGKGCGWLSTSFKGKRRRSMGLGSNTMAVGTSSFRSAAGMPARVWQQGGGGWPCSACPSCCAARLHASGCPAFLQPPKAAGQGTASSTSTGCLGRGPHRCMAVLGRGHQCALLSFGGRHTQG